MASHFETSNPPVSEPLTRRERDVLALLAEGLTAPEIAERLVLGLSTVKYHLQHVYAKLDVNSRREAIRRANELGLLAPATAETAASAPRQSVPAASIHNLPPQLTRFFGRKDDIARVQERLAEWRLVTLTGPGGVGKTRLSMRVAEETLAYFSDGVWFVELAPLSEPSAVARHMAHVVGERERSDRTSAEALRGFFEKRRCLLVMDNCEHLLNVCAWLAEDLLRASPGLRVLATSREPLGVRGEANYVVPSLPFPDPQRLLAFEEVARNTSVSLFMDRVRAVVPDYAVTPQNAASVARICQRLDGIPLALELAAARINILTLEQLAHRLDDVFSLLTSGSRTALPRHQTLRATIDWSYNLLGLGEQLLLQRLAIFAGGCTLAAAESVCSGDGLAASEVLPQLAALVQKSMVVTNRRGDGEPRYVLLEMVRQYAAEKLAAAGDHERLSQRHWHYFVSYLESNARQFLSRAWPTLFGQLQADLENLRLALAWAFEQQGDPEAGIRLVVAFQPVWFIWDRRETHYWARKGIEQLRRGDHTSAPLRARFLAWASAGIWCSQGARARADQSVTIARALAPPDPETLSWSLWMLAISLDDCYMEIQSAHWDQAEALLDEQEALLGALGADTTLDPRLYRVYNRWVRAMLANYRHDYERAEAYGQEGLRLALDNFSGMHAIGPYITLGDAALGMRHYDLAVTYYEKARSLIDYSNDRAYEDVRNNDILVLICEAHFRRGDLAEAFAFCRTCFRRVCCEFAVERLEMAARLFSRAGRYDVAARLSAAAEAESERSGRPTSTRAAAEYYWGDWRSRYADLTLEALVPGWPDRPDAAAIQEAWDEARAMTFDQARAYVDDLEM
jgi:predicted ATPase/DNA-binding CsgD family transcriptional regulator